MGQFLGEMGWGSQGWSTRVQAQALQPFLPPKPLPLSHPPASFLLLQGTLSQCPESLRAFPFPQSLSGPTALPWAPSNLLSLPWGFWGSPHRISCASSTHFQCSTGCSFSCSTVSSCCRPAFSAGPPARDKRQSPAGQEAEWEGEEKPWSSETPRELHSLHHSLPQTPSDTHT